MLNASVATPISISQMYMSTSNNQVTAGQAAQAHIGAASTTSAQSNSVGPTGSTQYKAQGTAITGVGSQSTSQTNSVGMDGLSQTNTTDIELVGVGGYHAVQTASIDSSGVTVTNSINGHDSGCSIDAECCTNCCEAIGNGLSSCGTVLSSIGSGLCCMLQCCLGGDDNDGPNF